MTIITVEASLRTKYISPTEWSAPMTYKERRVLELLQSGNDAAWSQFVQLLIPDLIKSLKFAIKNDELAEDLAHSFMVSVVMSVRKVKLDDPTVQAGSPESDKS
jgi:hypothetical protein